MKKFIGLVALSVSLPSLANSLPTESQKDTLTTRMCGENWPTQDGHLEKNPIFALINKQTKLEVKRIEADDIKITLSGYGGDWSLLQSLESLPCLISSSFGFCELDTANSFFINNTVKGSYSPYYHNSNVFGYGASVKNIAQTSSRSTLHTFNVRGITDATAARWTDRPVGEILFSSGAPEYQVGIDNYRAVSCSTSYVYVQNKPQASGLTSDSGTSLHTTGVFKFRTGQGSIDDEFSLFGAQNQPLQYVWIAKNLDASYSSSATTTVPYANLEFENPGQHIVSVKVFDGTYYSEPQLLDVVVSGNICSGPMCQEMN